MLGFKDGVKGYKLWCIEPNKQHIIISRYVIFDEKNMPFKNTGNLANTDSTRIEVESLDLDGIISDENVDVQQDSAGGSTHCHA